MKPPSLLCLSENKMSIKTSDNQIDFLIQLLADRDAFVLEKVREQILSLGEDALPFLEIAARKEDLGIRPQALDLITRLLPKRLGRKFLALSSKGPEELFPLEEGIFLMNQFGFPHLDVDQITEPLDALAEELKPLLKDEADPEGTVRILSRFLFKDKGFRGNKKDYYNPDNSYLNKVLENKKGLPVSLSVLCLLVAARLNLPVYGVGMPTHFILMLESAGEKIYFDPYNGGRILTPDDCARLLKTQGFKFDASYLNKTPPRQILIRMLRNLFMIYKNNGEPDKTAHIEDFVKILNKIPKARDFSALA